MSFPLALTSEPALHRVMNIDVDVVGPATSFRNASVAGLYAWWLQASGGSVPLKRQFDVTAHPQLAASLFLVELLDDGDFRFRLVGERVITLLGRNSTGKRVRNIYRDDFGHALDEYYASILADGRCRRCSGSLAFAYKDYWRFESVDCPLSSDGTRLDFILGALDLVD